MKEAGISKRANGDLTCALLTTRASEMKTNVSSEQQTRRVEKRREEKKRKEEKRVSEAIERAPCGEQRGKLRRRERERERGYVTNGEADASEKEAGWRKGEEMRQSYIARKKGSQ